MNKRIECVMLKMSLYVIILLFSLQFSAAITGKESEVVSPLLMDVNPSLTMENISELSTSSEPSQQGYFLYMYSTSSWLRNETSVINRLGACFYNW